MKCLICENENSYVSYLWDKCKRCNVDFALKIRAGIPCSIEYVVFDRKYYSPEEIIKVFKMKAFI